MNLNEGIPAPATVSPTPAPAQVMRCGGIACPPGTCDHTDDPADAMVHRCAEPAAAGGGPVPGSVLRVLDTSGSPLPGSVRHTMETRFGHDFGRVRMHTDAEAAHSAHAIRALAYTFGSHVVMGAGRFQPHSPTGERLLAHELTHVVQQADVTSRPTGISDPGDPAERQAERTSDAPARKTGAHDGVELCTRQWAGVGTVHRQMMPSGDSGASADAVAEREYGGGAAPRAQTCGRPSHCPPGFCDPYRSQQLAEYYRAKKRGWLMAGISMAVDSRVVPLWQEYLDGGSSPKNLTPNFAADFTASRSTAVTTSYLAAEAQRALDASRPTVTTTRSIDITSLVPTAIAAINTPGDPHEMNFNVPRDVAGNLAGGIGTNQSVCASGARPSPFNDERVALGTIELRRDSPTSVLATPQISYGVQDTIDLCPGDCGTPLEQVATVPLSQFEATGISGDVPFTVDFAAPATPSFNLNY